MKRLLILYVLFSILAGCSTKQSPVEKHGSNVGHEVIELTKNPTFQNEPLQSRAPSVQEKVNLDVPLISQKPELKYGCEVASLAMVLQYAGIKVHKMQLANSIKKDTPSLSMNKNKDIIQWGILKKNSFEI